jgi:hypothetical protein
MLPYFPFEGESYAMAMDTRPISPDSLIEVDDRYGREVAHKAAILASDERAYVQALPGTEAAAWETLTLLLPNMARHHPRHVALRIEGERWHWTNRLLGATTAFTPGDPASLPRPPLNWLGRQVQEDLLLLDGRAPGTPLVAGHLCFAAGWCLDDTLGHPFLTIHDPVPGFGESIGRPADLLMQRLKPGRPVGRVNWSLALDDELNHAPAVLQRRPPPPPITPDTAGDRLFLRLERQTLSRLPATGAVLFTIHTYVAPLGGELRDRDRLDRFAAVMRTLPPPMRDYKGITPYYEALLTYLERRRRDA